MHYLPSLPSFLSDNSTNGQDFSRKENHVLFFRKSLPLAGEVVQTWGIGCGAHPKPKTCALGATRRSDTYIFKKSMSSSSLLFPTHHYFCDRASPIIKSSSCWVFLLYGAIHSFSSPEHKQINGPVMLVVMTTWLFSIRPPRAATGKFKIETESLTESTAGD